MLACLARNLSSLHRTLDLFRARDWGSKFYFFARIFIYIIQEPMQKFEFLQQPLLGELAMSRKRERRKRENKMPFIVATYVSACSQGQRTHSARTNNSFTIASLIQIYTLCYICPVPSVSIIPSIFHLSLACQLPD